MRCMIFRFLGGAQLNSIAVALPFSAISSGWWSRRPWSRYLSQATQQQGATTELAVPGDRKFESISLQRRVSCEPVFLRLGRVAFQASKVTKRMPTLLPFGEGCTSGEVIDTRTRLIPPG
jgi:hypothetical protein